MSLIQMLLIAFGLTATLGLVAAAPWVLAQYGIVLRPLVLLVVMAAAHLMPAHLRYVSDDVRAERSLQHGQIAGMAEVLLKGAVAKIQDLGGCQAVSRQREAFVRMLRIPDPAGAALIVRQRPMMLFGKTVERRAGIGHSTVKIRPFGVERQR